MLWRVQRRWSCRLSWGERVVYWLLILALVTTVAITRFARVPVALFVNGEPIAWLSDIHLARRAMDLALSKMRQRFGMDTQFLEAVEMGNLPIPEGEHLLSPAEAAETLLGHVTPAKRAAVIWVNDRPLFALPSMKEAEQALELVKAHFVPEGAVLVKKPTFKEQVFIREENFALDQILPDSGIAAQRLIQGQEPPRYHTVKRGEVALLIARRYGLTLQELQRLNPGLDLERIFAGQKLLIRPGKPLVTVVAVVQEVTHEKIPYRIERKLIPDLPGGIIIMKRRGKPGLKEVVWEVILENGVEVKRRRVEEKVLQGPVSELLWIGGGLKR